MKLFRVALATLVFSAAIMGTGCGSDNNDFVLTTTNPVAAPVAVDDSYNALGNTTLTADVESGVLSNDTLNNGSITAFDATTANGGTVTVADNGSFTYNPPVGFVGSDSFGYTLTGPGGKSSATATISISKLYWYVDNTSVGGDGTFTSPFSTLADAVNQAAVNETIYVLFGDGTSTGLSGPVTLKTGQSLVGQLLGLDLGNVLPQQLVTPGQTPNLAGPIILADGVTVSGLRITGPGTEAALRGDNLSDVTLENLRLDSESIGALLLSIDGDATIANSTIVGGSVQTTGNSVANFTSQNNVWSRGSISNNFVSSSDTSTLVATFSGDTLDFQVDSTDDASATATLTECIGNVAFTGSVTSDTTGMVSNSRLSRISTGSFGATDIQLFVTDCALTEFLVDAASSPTRIEFLRVHEVNSGFSTWDASGLLGTFVATDSSAQSVNVLGQGSANSCFNSKGGSYGNVTLQDLTVDDEANFTTDNTVVGTYDTSGGGVVDGICP